MISPRLKTAYVASVLLVLVVFSLYLLRSTGVGPRESPTSSGTPASPTTSTPGEPPRTNQQLQFGITETEVTSSFHHAKECYDTHIRTRQLQLTADCDRLASRPGLENAYATCLKDWADAQQLIAAAQRSSANLHCGDERSIFQDYYASTKEAATKGSADAQMCYLQSSFFYLDDQPRQYSQADIADYVATSPKYINEAFARGDWRIVELLSTDHHGGIVGLMLYIPNIGMPEMMYKMNVLLRLGADKEYAKELDAKLEMLTQPDGHRNPDLPQNKIDEANAWAHKTYSQYFAAAPRLSKPPYACGIEIPEPDTP